MESQTRRLSSLVYTHMWYHFCPTLVWMELDWYQGAYPRIAVPTWEGNQLYSTLYWYNCLHVTTAVKNPTPPTQLLNQDQICV